MQIAQTAKLFAARSLWTLGSLSAGRTLLEALDSTDEDTRTLAGMFLVQGGRRSEPLLEEALRERRSLPLVLTILGDIGDRQAEVWLQKFSDDPDAETARAARDALAALRAGR